jgi:hypothetical protein
MTNIVVQALSRRQWLGRVSASALAALFGSGVARAAESDIALREPIPGAHVYDIRRFGAKGDGVTLDTVAVQAAIDACTGDRGGTVLVPAGDFLIGTVELKSHVTLHIAAQGRLLGSPNIEHYAAGNGIPRSNGNIVLLSAANAENITIEGNGIIDGNGAKFYTGAGDNTGPGGDPSQGYFQRPHLTVFYRCRNLRIRDVFLTASAYHCTRILECRDVHIDGVRIHNRVNKNNDGFHINSSQYVHIAGCDVACQDDACALFGSNKFVTVTNCTFSTRWSVFRFGGGEPENITVSNCVIYETYGCPIKMRFGARSRAENISFSNLILKDVTGPISIGLDSRSRRATDSSEPRPRGIVRNIAFHGIRATVLASGRQHNDLPFPSSFRPGETRTCIVLNAVGEDYLEKISFDDVHVTYEGGGTADEARAEVPAIAGEYFEIGTPPAYGLYARNVRGLTLHNMRLQATAQDLRPAIIFDHVMDAAVNGLGADGNPQAECILRFRDSQDVLLTAPRVLTPAAAFLRVEGAASQGITIDGGALSKAAKPLSFASDARENAVKLRDEH